MLRCPAGLPPEQLRSDSVKEQEEVRPGFGGERSCCVDVG